MKEGIQSIQKERINKDVHSQTKEFVYYHPLQACLPKEITRDELIISAKTRSRLEASHREVIWREFGLSL